jgi:hypothetical protein
MYINSAGIKCSDSQIGLGWLPIDSESHAVKPIGWAAIIYYPNKKYKEGTPD